MSQEARKRLWEAWTAAHVTDDVETVTVSMADLHAVLVEGTRDFSVVTRIRALISRYESEAKGGQ